MSWGGEEPGAMLVLGVLVALSTIAAGWIRERRASHGATWRRAAILIAASAMFVLIVQPRIKRSVDLRTALVLTPGATRQVAEDNGFTIDSSVLSVALPGVEPWSTSTDSAPDLATYLRRHPEVDHLRVLGAGLEPWDLVELSPSVDGTGLVSPEPGVAVVSWRRRLRLGEWLRVTGHLVGLTRGTATLRLEGPGESSTNVELSAAEGEGPVPFTLQLQPPGSGRFLYRLSVTGATGIADSSEVVDVHVVEADLPAILWLEDAPNFETQHFKRWLADEGGELAIRTRISRDRYHLEFHNLETLALSGLDPDLLRRFDLLIAEQRAWVRLSPAEQAVIEQACRETGLGVLVRLGPDGIAEDDSGWPLGFSGSRIPDVDQLLVQPAGEIGAQVSPVETAPFELALAPSMTPLFTDRVGRVLAIGRPLGRGSVGVTLLRQTFSWVLEGFPETQRRYWRRLIEALARPEDSSAWQIAPGPVFVDEPLELALRRSTEIEAIPEASFGRIDESQAAIAMRQDPVVPSHWTAQVWPSSAGWHGLEADGVDLEFYVAEDELWPSLRQQRRRAATRLAALRPRSDRLESATLVDRPIPRWPFFAIVLLCLGLLWLDERRGF